MNITRTHLAAAFALLAILATFILLHRSADETGNNTSTTATSNIRAGERTEPDAATKERMRREAIDQAAQKWYERILDRHPDMRPVFRDVPDEENGYLQFIRFVEAIDSDKPLPNDLKMMFADFAPWDSAKAQAWLAENQNHLDRLLQIAELPDRSNKGISFRNLDGSTTRQSSYFTGMLRASARLAFESGDPEKALRHMKASISLTDHFADLEAPNMLGEIIAVGARAKAQQTFQENFLPTLDPASLASWNDALFRKEKPASEYRRIMKGEWNYTMRDHALPQLLGKQLSDGESPIPDIDGFADAYAETIRKSADGASAMGPDRFDVASAQFGAINPNLDPETAQGVRDALGGLKNIAEGISQTLTKQGMTQATIAALSGNEMPTDPVSGKPFQWDPATRTLSAPEGVDGIDPIKVP